tara:strand:+ start:194548 stop:196182 length:1635 start_codon:yes stop_codon:yes gene_type:complete
MNKFLEQFQEFFGPLSPAQRVMFVALILLILSIMGGVLYWSQQEDEMLLFGSLQPEVAQQIIDELDNQGVKYRIGEGGDAIYVPANDVHELRLAMAPITGGAGSDIKGYELFDTNALGMTDFMQEVNKKRALEGELARSINSLEQVEYTRIHLVLPERSPFMETAVEASASVILNIKPGKSLTPDQIDGITALIAGSVEELEAGNVTVIDQAGNRLTEEIDYDSEVAFGTTQMQLRQKTEAYLTERGQTMLDRVLGAGNSILRVSVEHNFDRLIRESDLIDPDSRTIISEEKREQSNNDEVMEPVERNEYTPITQQNAAVVVAANDNQSLVQTRNYEVNRTREVFEKTQGELKNITASVLLNYKEVPEVNEEGEEVMVQTPYTAMEVEEFREAVSLALGIKEDRGDKLTIKQVEFYEHHYVSGDQFIMDQPTSISNIIRWSVIGVTFLVIVFMINGIRKKVGQVDDLTIMSDFDPGEEQLDAAPEPISLPDMNEPEPQPEIAAAEPPQEEVKVYSKTEIKDFVELKPALAAEIMRAMADPEAHS